MATKASGAVLKFLQKIGSKGGTSRAKIYDAKTIKKWSSMGGRPPVYRHTVSTPQKEHTFRTQIEAKKFFNALRRKLIESVSITDHFGKVDKFTVKVKGRPDLRRVFLEYVDAEKYATAEREKLLATIKRSQKPIKNDR